MTRIVAVTGVAPAVGTSTLVRDLGGWFAGQDLVVELVEEDELLTRPAFAPLARELAVTGAGTVETLTSCVAAFAAECARFGDDVVMCDALFPFVRELSDWGNGEITIDGFLAECLQVVGPVELTVVYLDADVRAALRHAEVREPQGWVEWYVDHLVREEPDSLRTSFDAAVELLERERELALRLMDVHGWDVRRIPETDLLSHEEILERARRLLELSPA